MKKLFTIGLCLAIAIGASAQDSDAKAAKKEKKKYKTEYGIKAGYNFSKPTSAESFKPDNRSGFMIAGFISPPTHGIIGYRSELIFSRQGFGYDDDGQKQNVQQDYIYMPHFTTINIKRVVQFQVGMQVGYLISSTNSQKENSNNTKLNDYFNRIDYGFAGGVEVYPFKGIIIGGRYNGSLGKLYKEQSATVPSPFPFNPNDLKTKNAVIQVFAGYKF